MMKRALSMLLLPAVVMVMMMVPALAQSTTTDYVWAEAGLALRHPAGWTAVPAGDAERRTLTITAPAQGDALPAVLQVIVLPAVPESERDTWLTEALRALEVQPARPFSLVEEDIERRVALARSRDGAQIGRGWIQTGPEGTLLLVGRAAVTDDIGFIRRFNALSHSLTTMLDLPLPAVAPGRRWQQVAGTADGLFAWTNPAALLFLPPERVLLVDATAGLVTLDAHTGAVLALVPFAAAAQPVAAAAGPDGSLYIADTLCACVQRWWAGGWSIASAGYAAGAPGSLAVAADGTLYATDAGPDGLPLVRALAPEGRETRLLFPSPLTALPLLFMGPDDRLHALTLEGAVLRLAGDAFSPAGTLEVEGGLPGVRALAPAAGGGAWLAVPDGVLGVDAAWQVTERRLLAGLLPEPPLNATVTVTALAAAPDGGLFLGAAGDFGGVALALQPGLPAGRTGDERLRPGQVVAGALDARTRSQMWTFGARAGDPVQVYVSSDLFSGLDVALRLIAPDGREVAFVDMLEVTADLAARFPESLPLNPADPALLVPRLPQEGVYVLLVERSSGAGTYQLGLSQPQPLPETPAPVYGALSEALPEQTYTLAARAGDLLTITVSEAGGTLLPALRLYNARGDEIAYADSLSSPAPGINAQLVQVRLPGSVSVRVVRQDGSGPYRLTWQQTR
jgi:hypothetical protein